ncbi:MAG: hypothetical protein WC903_04845 [Candidatus Margulisiibacteriota bacterium]
MILPKLGRRIFHAGLLMTALTALSSTTGCGSKPRVRIALSESPSMSYDESIVCGPRPPMIKRDASVIPDMSKLPAEYPKDKMGEISRLVAELNQLIPDHPVKTIYPVSTCQGGESFGEAITISDSVFLETAAHEVGHSVYHDFGPRDQGIGSIWLKLNNISLGHKNYELVRDQNYIDPAIIRERNRVCGNDHNLGHPWDNSSELFASSFMIYRIHPDEFIAKIQDPATSRENKEFGKLVYVFFRDWVFHGRTFSKTDPFKNEALCQTLKGNRLETMRKAAEASLPSDYSSNKNPWLRHTLYWRILQTTEDYRVFVNTLIQGLSDENARNRHEAYQDINANQYDAKRFPKSHWNRFHNSPLEMHRIWTEAKFGDLLLKALENEVSIDNTENCYRIIDNLEYEGNKNMIPQLEKYKDHPFIGKYVKQLIDKLSN